MMNGALIKVLGLTATIVGAGATLVSNWVSDKKMEQKIDEKVNEAIAKRDENEEEES